MEASESKRLPNEEAAGAARDTRAGRGRRKRAYPEDAGATEDAARRRVAEQPRPEGTSSASADHIRVTRSVSIPRSEIELRTSRSSGPGGQHAQKTETRVEARFEVEASLSLSPAQKRRVLAKAGPVLRAVAQDERSQHRNRELAVERIVDQLREALRIERRRRPTKPTAASVERRLEEKRRRSQTKRLRQPPQE
jgi:ribosome-associated protein